MQGSVRKKGATWSYRIDIGLVNGKRKQKEKSGFRTKKNAQQALTMALNELNTNGRIIEDKKITFQEVFESFIKNEASITRKPSTITRYNSLYNNHFKNPLDHRFMNTLTASELQSFLTQKVATHSTEYVRSIYNLLLVLFSYSVRMEFLKNNVMENVLPPTKQDSPIDSIRVYTLDELHLMYERLATTNLQPAFNIGSNIGVRAGENYALRWSDIDLNNNFVKIDKQLQYYNKRWCFTTLKTKNSYRTVVFSNVFKQYLKELKKKQDMTKHFYTDCYKQNSIYDIRDKNKPKTIKIDDFINIKPNGEMLNTYSHKVISRIMQAEYGITFKYHNLRHTHATLLLEKGINPKYIQARLGHSKLEFTLKLYTHITANMDKQAINIMEDMFAF